MTFTNSLARRARRGVLVLGAVAALMGCGGGTSPVEAFVASGLFAFGDETSTLTADGRKYSVNVLTDAKAIDCAVQPIWVQAVAALYGIVFAECNPNALAETRAIMGAAAGAKAADLPAQIDAVVAAGGFGEHPLATVLMGANDVIELYAQYPARSEAEITEDLRTRGEAIAAQINRLVGLDVRVLVSTVPDLGRSPFAIAEKAAHADTDRAALLSRLTTELNASIRINIINDGRKLGLVLADEMVQAMAKSPSSFSITSAIEGVCTVALPDCTVDTLVPDGKSLNWLWADDRHLAYGGQQRLGLLAQSRARNNPF